MKDHELVKAYLQGDEKAFQKLVSLYTKQIYNFSLNRVGNSEDAADISQEVFLKVWKNIHAYNPEHSFKTWIYTIARNTTVDWLRKRKNVLFSQMDSTFENDTETYENTLLDTQPSAPELFEQKEMEQVLDGALSTIPSEHKKIIILHHIEGLTFAEISSKVSKPLNTIKSQYRRSIAVLKRQLDSLGITAPETY